MQTENLTITDEQQQILNAVAELHDVADFMAVKNDLVEMYENALLSENFCGKPEFYHSRFYSFKYLYNFLLKMELTKNPDWAGVNILH